MLAIKGTTIKQDFKKICERVCNGEVVIVSRPHNENVVLISEKDYAEFERLKRNMAYLQKLDQAIEQRKDGTMKAHELIEE